MTSVLILGGTGFVARNLLSQLLLTTPSSPAAALSPALLHVKVVDKKHPKMQHLSQDHSALYDDERVTFAQCDLSRKSMLDKAFSHPSGDASAKWDLIVNLAAETANGCSHSTYEARCLNLSKNCAEYASTQLSAPPTLYVEMSTAAVYASQSRTPAKEDAQLSPWTIQAQYKLKAEEAVKEVAHHNTLPLVIFRPAIIYGNGDKSGLMPRAVAAATYVNTGESMNFLWDGALRMNTVHVVDVCRAVMHAYQNPSQFSSKIFNLSDYGDSDQQKVNGYLGELFGINVGFVGRMLSNVARINMDGAVEVANEKHLQPWGKLCAERNIDTVLSPFIHRELLERNHVNVDGSAISTSTGFVYQHPELTPQLLKGMIMDAVETKLFPDVLVSDTIPESEGKAGEETKIDNTINF
ncbi:hypothetical protein TrVE_jg12831 [Triparma verrucosa]|uniref:NAD-dependent epimerase/dehydratase domain-containing protein n=1 Tax=Triparma verrucosa TaxID=1606542 RepID=A0A9W7FMU3_9STRA|nr:hypothetical protein TrVE_jg12831 [Triparma verrucosa]